MRKTTALKRLLALCDRAALAAGAHNGLSARLAERAGFDALWASGFEISASHAVPDANILTMSENLAAARDINDAAAALPVLADCDNGYGNAVNVVRTVRDLDRAGAACVQIEDQLSPKRCGHLPGKQVVSRAEFIGKIRAACDHRGDPGLAIMARTDARATHGFEEAVARGNEALEAGADLVFVEALESPEEFAAYARRCPGPLLANMTEFGKTPLIPAREFGQMGYRFVIFPASALRVMLRAASEFLDEIREKGTQAAFLERMMTRRELYDLIGYDAYHRIEARYLPRE